MDFLVVDKININYDRCQKVGEFLYDPLIDGIYLDSPWPFPVQLGITNNLKNCVITKGFLKLPFILKGWVNHDILLRLIDVLKYVDKNVIMMHASCTNDTLIVGLPNAGKTYQTYTNVAKGEELISEEYTLIENGIARPYKPMMRTCFSPSTLKAAGMKLSTKENIKMFLNTIRAKLMPFMFEAAIWKELPASGNTSKIKRIVYGSSGKEIKHWKEFAILCENEFPFMASEFLQAYSLATGFDLIDYQQRQRQLIKDFVESVYPKRDSSKS